MAHSIISIDEVVILYKKKLLLSLFFVAEGRVPESSSRIIDFRLLS